jgi:hypothetical protein
MFGALMVAHLTIGVVLEVLCCFQGPRTWIMEKTFDWMRTGWVGIVPEDLCHLMDIAAWTAMQKENVPPKWWMWITAPVLWPGAILLTVVSRNRARKQAEKAMAVLRQNNIVVSSKPLEYN